MLNKLYINDNWLFFKEYSEELKFLTQQTNEMQVVRLPHSVVTTPLNSFSAGDYQMLCGYVKFFSLDQKLYKDKRVFITFEGAGHTCEIFCNGIKVGEHNCGYTSVQVEITNVIDFKMQNNLTVKLNSSEKLNIPPFGGVIDYMTYGGIYRDVYLSTTMQVQMTDVFVHGDHTGNFECTFNINSASKMDKLYYKISIKDRDKNQVFLSQGKSNAVSGSLANVKQWSDTNPYLYTIDIECYLDELLLDKFNTKFGFRTVEFKADGFYLNGEKFVLRGLNRHQSYPYIGYAMPKRPQILDADILKYELGCNAVRTSHYPNSHYFIDRCDEIGLLVFTEIPGWQHIGDENWQNQAIKNTKDMVLEYRNHPSIFVWGVRINESADNDKFYTQTNKVCHELDATRKTTGVRFIKKSSLLEDVYSYNDFIHSGLNKGCDPKKAVSPNMEKGYIVSEYNGHMFPTKPFDDEVHILDHALRHAKVLNDIASHSDIAGSFGWCMFDYNTHKDFGSGDMVCYHGVMDMFRNPKLASSVYSSQADLSDVLEISSSMDIGEWQGGAIKKIVVFTNADYVNLYKNDKFVGSYYPSLEFANLKHPPIIIDDTIGCLIDEHENYSKRQSKAIKEVLLGISKHGMNELPIKHKLLALSLLVRGRTFEEMHKLYSKYVAEWGGESVEWRFEGVKKDKKVSTKIIKTGEPIEICAIVDSTNLCEESSYDVASVRISVKDIFGKLARFCQRAVKLIASGDIEIIGSDIVPLIGGQTGCYIKTVGKSGKGSLTIKIQGCKDKIIDFEIEKN